jgi:cytoskeletal protein CcmA (bactofilin family)
MKFGRKRSLEFKGFLDHGTTLTGELHFSGALRIDGTVHGSNTTSDLLIVGEHVLPKTRNIRRAVGRNLHGRNTKST